MNIVRRSGVIVTPVTSQSVGEVRKRRVVPLFGSAHIITLPPIMQASWLDGSGA